MLMVWLGVAFATSGEVTQAIASDLTRYEQLLAEHGRYSFDFTEAEIERLAAGSVVKRREKREGADRVVGAVWADVPLRELWVAVQDEWHWGHVSGLIEEKLPHSTFQDKILYQRVDAPWPFKDRQWVIRIRNNLDLLEASQNQAIERTWDLVPDRGATAEVEDGVWVPVNDGGWFAAPVGGGSLLVYHVRAVVGGHLD